jgi:hypothetical protein
VILEFGFQILELGIGNLYTGFTENLKLRPARLNNA